MHKEHEKESQLRAMPNEAPIRPRTKVADRPILALAINFCPGWKAYFLSLGEAERDELQTKYHFTKYQHRQP